MSNNFKTMTDLQPMNAGDSCVLSERTEEVQDIIDRMPVRTAFYVTIFIVVLTLLIFVAGWFINYPESIRGTLVISTNRPPVRLVAQTSGNIILLNPQIGTGIVKRGEMFAVFETAADPMHIRLLDSIIVNSPEQFLGCGIELPKKIELGILNRYYFQFTEAVNQNKQYIMENQFESQLQQFNLQVAGIQKQLHHINIQLEIQYENIRVASQNHYKDSLQYFSIKAITETEYLKTKTSYLMALQSKRVLLKEIDLAYNQLQNLEVKKHQLSVEERVHKKELDLNLYSTYNNLVNEIREWKKKYAFISPYTGQLEMLNFWQNWDFVQEGSEVFSILSEKNQVKGQVFIPSQGAGKIVLGQEVIVKLHDFPYLEYGVIKGNVKSISMVTSQVEKALTQNNIHTYLVTIDLPQQLTTTYGSKLPFRPEIRGDAEIITSKRRLIERLFDNLRYRTN